MNMKDLKVAILLEKLEIENFNETVYIANCPILGYTLKDNIFLNILTGEKFVDISVANKMNLDNGYAFSVMLKELKKKNAHVFPIASFFQNVEDFIYLYDDEKKKIIIYTENSFKEEYGIDLKHITTLESNEELISLLKGENKKDDTVSEDSRVKHKDDILISYNEAKTRISKMIISQDEAIKEVLISIFKSRKFDSSFKSNILIYGESGVGKTELIKSVAKVFDIPVLIEDMTRYTDTGYVGSSAIDILQKLYYNAGKDLEKAENSILFLDEIDKKASNGRNYDFNKGDVLFNLLKIIEGGKFDIETDNGLIEFDTSKLIVIASGAFSRLFTNNNNKINKIGFESKTELKQNNKVTIKDLENYGMPIEFLGRFNKIVKMNSLSEEDFVKILKNSEICILRKYIDMFNKMGIKLEIKDEVYKKIAHLAYNYKMGARGLNVVVEKIFDNLFCEIIDEFENIESIELNENVLEEKCFTLKRKVKCE